MSLPKQKSLSREEFLELLDDGDVAALWSEWKLPTDSVMRKDSPVFLAAVNQRSKTTLLQDAMGLRTVTLQMLRDILDFMSSHMSAVRTTASVIVLRDNFDIAPQQVDAALRWSARALRHSSATWEGLTERFRSEVKPVLEKVKRYGRVEFSRKRENIVRYLMRTDMGRQPSYTRYVATAVCDADGLKLRQAYDQKIAELNQKLSELEGRLSDARAQELVSELAGLYADYHRSLGYALNDYRKAEDKRSRDVRAVPSASDHEVWKSFAEDVLALAEAEESASVADVFRMDLFRKRPQLYEVWVVVTILRTMRNAGYAIELLTSTITTDRVVWMLNYAKSQLPIARLVRASNGSEYFLFYQLFKPGELRDEMPDIALMSSQEPDDKPLWIMDPKHSERAAYSLSNYSEVGKRYQTAFSALKTWIVEFYPRQDLGSDNPLVIHNGVELVRDVSPGGAGYKYLINELHKLHGRLGQTVAIIDCSGSYADAFGRITGDLRAFAAQGISLCTDVIWFADTAARTSVDADMLEHDGGNLRPPSDLGGGTNFCKALELAEAISEECTGDVAFRIYTDGQFADISLEAAVTQLQRRGDVKIIKALDMSA